MPTRPTFGQSGRPPGGRASVRAVGRGRDPRATGRDLPRHKTKTRAPTRHDLLVLGFTCCGRPCGIEHFGCASNSGPSIPHPPGYCLLVAAEYWKCARDYHVYFGGGRMLLDMTLRRSRSSWDEDPQESHNDVRLVRPWRSDRYLPRPKGCYEMLQMLTGSPHTQNIATLIWADISLKQNTNTNHNCFYF